MIKILMGLISILASLPIVIVAAFYFLPQVNLVVQLIAGIVFTTLVIFIFRAIFRKERPNINGISKKFLNNRMTRSRMRFFRDKFLELEQRSFASAHVARIGVYLAIFYLNAFSFDWLLGALAFMVLMGIARLAMKRHRFFDLITGAAIGLASGYAAFYLYGLYF